MAESEVKTRLNPVTRLVRVLPGAGEEEAESCPIHMELLFFPKGNATSQDKAPPFLACSLSVEVGNLALALCSGFV